MRKIFHAIWIIGIIWWVISTTNDLKAFKADVTAARTLSVNYEGKSIIAGDGLKSLVGKKGNIKWHSADTENSGKQDAAVTSRAELGEFSRPVSGGTTVLSQAAIGESNP